VVFPLDAMLPTISPYLGVEDLEAIGLVGTATPCGATAAQSKYGLWYGRCNVAPHKNKQEPLTIGSSYDICNISTLTLHRVVRDGRKQRFVGMLRLDAVIRTESYENPLILINLFIAPSILDSTGPPEMTDVIDQCPARGGELKTAVIGRPRRTVADLLRLCRSPRIIGASRGGKVPKIALRLFAVILALLGGLSVRTAGTSEINVLCSGAMRAVLQQLTPAFEESSGDKLVVAYASAGKVADKVAAEEVIDVAILTKPRADKLVRAAKLVGGTTTVLARVWP
jgi:hypothetical protein